MCAIVCLGSHMAKVILALSVSWHRIYCRCSVCYRTHVAILVSKSGPQHCPFHFSIICVPINFLFLWQSHNFSLTEDHRQNEPDVQFWLQEKGHLFCKNLHELLNTPPFPQCCYFLSVLDTISNSLTQIDVFFQHLNCMHWSHTE